MSCIVNHLNQSIAIKRAKLAILVDLPNGHRPKSQTIAAKKDANSMHLASVVLNTQYILVNSTANQHKLE